MVTKLKEILTGRLMITRAHLILKTVAIIALLFATPVAAEIRFLDNPSDGRWTGFVYPSKHNLRDDIEIGDFKSLSACRMAITKLISAAGWPQPDYECGLNCKGVSKPYICERTER